MQVPGNSAGLVRKWLMALQCSKGWQTICRLLGPLGALGNWRSPLKIDGMSAQAGVGLMKISWVRSCWGSQIRRAWTPPLRRRAGSHPVGSRGAGSSRKQRWASG